MDEGAIRALTALFNQFKKPDVTMQCQERFDRLMAVRATLPQENASESLFISFYRRFWELQHDQFLFWQKGLLDEDFYAIWLSERKVELDSATVFKLHSGRSFTCRTMWEDECSGRYSGRPFERFMRLLIAEGHEAALSAFRI